MIRTLVVRQLTVRKARTAFLLLGFAVGVATMIVLLAVGEAMVVQYRDVSLVGGGDVTVLPDGLDLDALRTGALTGMFFGIDRARFVGRVMLGGARHRDLVSAVNPRIDGELLYLEAGSHTVAVRASGEIPSQARAAGAGFEIARGRWEDTVRDSAWIVPTRQQLYDELDRFHLPPAGDSTWGEWHYFNVVTGPDEWWYITYLVGGDVPDGRWAGRLLVTHRLPGGGYEEFSAQSDPEDVRFDTARADVRLGESFVRQRDGVYAIEGVAEGDRGDLRFRLRVEPDRFRYFPPVEQIVGDQLSGYVVPALRATASGRLCVATDCSEAVDAPAYHDHNWGFWSGVTWEWEMGRGEALDLLYGGVDRGGEEGDAGARFLAVVDSFGVRQVLRFDDIVYEGARPVAGLPGIRAPERFALTARRRDGLRDDWLRLEVAVRSVQATPAETTTDDQVFLQLRGEFSVTGELTGIPVSDRGQGFFETYVSDSSVPASSGARP